MRTEQEIFEELAALCAQPGYLHAIAFFCFRDNLIRIPEGEKFAAKHLHNLYGDERLIRTEITTLLGLALKGPLDVTLPSPHTLQEYLTRTELLLKELHEAMGAVVFAGLTPEALTSGTFNPFASGAAMREPIFYGGESAYGFQYREFAVRKYGADDPWLKANKGFTIGDAAAVVRAICDHQGSHLPAHMEQMRHQHPSQWTVLPGFECSVDDIARQSKLPVDVVTRVIEAFTVPAGERNVTFRTLGDFNAAAAYPILKTGPTTFLVLQQYGILEALYEAPFYWMTADSTYRAQAWENRGKFAEQFSEGALRRVFGSAHVFSNVDIYESKAKRLGEIDVLVLFGDRAIVLQSKSKRLTLEARKGNDLQIKDDFKKSVQDAYDQGLLCAKALGDPHRYRVALRDGRTLTIPKLEETYIFCVVTDHYPALAFQARQFLKYETTEKIPPPFVMDVFTLDAMTEMLQSPLRLLSYANRRTRYEGRISSAHELTILSYHLKKNLWLGGEHDFVMLHDDISADLDVAMIARREGLPGRKTPSGILTKLANTSVGRLVETIERSPQAATIALGFELLKLSEDAVEDISKAIDQTVDASRSDGKHHDVTIATGKGESGITIHCNDDPHEVAMPRLQSYCRRRKYRQKADSWFGVWLSPDDGSPKAGVSLTAKWEFNEELEQASRGMQPASANIRELLKKPRKARKLGRNDPCPCGSGKKYKKCHLGRD